MINFIFVLLIYLSFAILIFALKINKNSTGKKKVLTIVIPTAAFFLQLIIEWIIYMILFVFGDSKSTYISWSMIINAIELFIPFLTVFVMGSINGCTKKIGIISLIVLIFAVLSFIMKYIYSDALFKTLEDLNGLLLEDPESLSYMDSLTNENELEGFQRIILVLNALPALLLEIYLTVTAKSRNNNLRK